jgi:hypothetical protein
MPNNQESEYRRSIIDRAGAYYADLGMHIEAEIMPWSDQNRVWQAAMSKAGGNEELAGKMLHWLIYNLAGETWDESLFVGEKGTLGDAVSTIADLEDVPALLANPGYLFQPETMSHSENLSNEEILFIIEIKKMLEVTVGRGREYPWVAGLYLSEAADFLGWDIIYPFFGRGNQKDQALLDETLNYFWPLYNHIAGKTAYEWDTDVVYVYTQNMLKFYQVGLDNPNAKGTQFPSQMSVDQFKEELRQMTNILKYDGAFDPDHPLWITYGNENILFSIEDIDEIINN